MSSAVWCVAGLAVAAAVDDEVEAAVERELLEEVVVEPRAGGDAHAAGAVEPEPDADRRLRRRAHVRTLRDCGARLAGERREQEVVVLAVADA